MNWNRVGFFTNKVVFHRYLAVRLLAPVNSSTDQIKYLQYYVGMNDRLFVNIEFNGWYGASLSEAEAEIEKFANAIDFNGFTASA